MMRWLLLGLAVAFLAVMFRVGYQFEDVLWSWLMVGDWWRGL